MRPTTFEEYIAEQMKDPEFKEEWKNLDSEFELIESMIRARERSGLTQAELAMKKCKAHN